jgi:hypothetical protein
MVFIGGGAGMAPMRSHIFDQLKRKGSNSKRKISFWYGARSLREMFYVRRSSTARRGERELLVARRAVRSAARGQLGRSHRLHPQRALRAVPQGPPGAGETASTLPVRKPPIMNVYVDSIEKIMLLNDALISGVDPVSAMFAEVLHHARRRFGG